MVIVIVIVTVISFIGVESISISYLWIGILAYMLIMGVGAIIVKFR